MVLQNVASYTIRLGGQVLPSIPQAFGQVSREVKETRGRLQELIGTQGRLQEELKGVKRGSEEYERIRGEIVELKDEIKSVNETLKEQQSAWDELSGRTQKFKYLALGGVATIGASVAALTVQVNKLGTEFENALFISDHIDIAFEDIARFQAQARGLGVEVGADAFRGLESSIASQQLSLERQREQAAATGNFFDERLATLTDGFTKLGLDVRKLSAKDFPLIIEQLDQVEDDSLRALLRKRLWVEA